MGREDVDQLPVTSNGRVEGIVTRRLCLKYGGRVRPGTCQKVGSAPGCCNSGMRQYGENQATMHKRSDNEGKPMHKQQALELIPDFLGEDRHDFVAKLAHKFWEERGRPFGSPEVDWFAAERVVYSSLLTSGLIPQSANDSGPMAEKIYR